MHVPPAAASIKAALALVKSPIDGIRPKSQFAPDSPLEEAVSSEPVSERGSSAAGNYGTIPRRLWMITEAEKGHFGLEYAGIWVFALR